MEINLVAIGYWSNVVDVDIALFTKTLESANDPNKLFPVTENFNRETK